MGFKDARARLLDCLREDRIGHWPREDYLRKNWLLAGRMNSGQVLDLLLQCRADHYRSSPHDFEPGTTVHEFLPYDGPTRWNIKVFFDDDMGAAVFMSVQPSEG